MNRLLLVLGCAVLAVGAEGVFADTIVWDFNPYAKNKSVKSSSFTTNGSLNGLPPLDPATPLVTADGFNADGTSHILFWKKMGKKERGLGVVKTRNSELTLDKTGTAIANYLRIDMTNALLLDWEDLALSISMSSVGKNSKKDQEQFDIWGSDTPLFSSATKLINGSLIDGSFIPIPQDNGHYDNYYFVTVTPQGKANAKDNVLLQAIKLEGTKPVPEPASLTLLGLGVPVLLRRRRQRGVTAAAGRTASA